MSNRPTIAYQPALDGVRAFAVVAVLLFHAGVPGFDGGYLGVSVFFTLSGFLITSLILSEHAATGTIDLAGFYARRLRRLLPASVICLLGVAVLAAFTDLFDGVTNLRAHLLGSVLQVANWVFLAGDGSYQDLLARSSGSSSPLEHFWSLAIEEQFYWVWPPLMLLVLTRVPGHRGRLAVVGGIALLTSLSAPVIARVWGADAAYWATPARISEIIIGALLAVVLATHRPSERVAPLAPAALVVLVACIVAFPSSSGPAYSGALPLVALVSASLVLGLHAPGGVRRLLEIDGIVWVGKVSYGLYLFHWPIFVLVHPDRFGWPGPLLFAARLVLTFAVTIVSYELIEQPIRVGRRLGPRLTFTTAAMSTVAVVVAALALVPTGAGEYWNPDAETVEAAAIEVNDEPLIGLAAATPATTGPAPVASSPASTASASTAPASTEPSNTVAGASSSATTEPSPAPASAPTTEPEPLPSLSRPVRIIVTGDSTANAFGTGLVNWAADHPELAQVEVVAAPGCGFLVGGERRTGDTIAPIEGCDGWVDTFVYPEVERLEPDVVVAMVTSWDLVDRRWGGEVLLTPFDAEFADRLDADYRTLSSRLIDSGAGTVAFVRHPIPDPFWLPAADAQEDPGRHEVIYDLYERIATDDDRVAVVELDRWLIDLGLDQSEELRPDGIHPTPEAATELSEQYLGDRLVRIALGLPQP